MSKVSLRLLQFIRNSFGDQFEPSLNFDDNPVSNNLVDLHHPDHQENVYLQNTYQQGIGPENHKRFFVVDHNAQDQFNFPDQPRQNQPDLVSFINPI